MVARQGGAGPDAARRRAVSVAAVIVTYNRREIVDHVVAAVAAQTRVPDEVIVVDNGSVDGTAAHLAEHHPAAVVVQLDDNRGFAAGLSAGTSLALGHGHDYVWLLDDDSTPVAGALAAELAVASRVPRLGIIGLEGGLVRRGTPVRTTPLPSLEALDVGATGPASRCDYVLVDGALLASEAARDVGLFRDDFFMMYEDLEYTGRLRAAGWTVVLLDRPMIERAHLGSARGGANAWRAYYHSRNQLRVAIDHRSPAECYGWLVRQAKYCAAAVSARRWQIVRLRLLGAWHATRGRMGRTLNPADGTWAAGQRSAAQRRPADGLLSARS